MSERLPEHNADGDHERRLQPRHEKASEGPEVAHRHHEQAADRHELKEKIHLIRSKAEQEALSAAEHKIGKEDKHYKPSEAFVNKELKTMAYSRLLNRARRHLNPADKLLSKVIHQPVVDKVSEVSAKTIGRPSGLLGGGLLAFGGTSIYYYITKHYGYDYNYFVFILLLILGFVTGWAAELLLNILRSPKRKS